MLVPVADENVFKVLMYCRQVISIVNMRVARPILEKKIKFNEVGNCGQSKFVWDFNTIKRSHFYIYMISPLRL